MSRQILVGVSLGGDYQAYEGRKERPSWPLLSVYGWIDMKGVSVSWFFGSQEVKGGESAEFLRIVRDGARARYHNMRWLEECTVLDASPDQELPDELFVMVRSYQTEASWYANEAFLSKDIAEERVRSHLSSYEWYWMQPCRRFVAEKQQSGSASAQHT